MPPKMTVRGSAGSAGVTPEPVVESDQVQDVQVLALVLVQPLHLDVEERVRIHDDAGSLLDEAGQGTFVVGLDRSPLALEVDIVGQRLQSLRAHLPDPRSIGRRCAG